MTKFTGNCFSEKCHSDQSSKKVYYDNYRHTDLFILIIQGTFSWNDKKEAELYGVYQTFPLLKPCLLIGDVDYDLRILDGTLECKTFHDAQVILEI